MGRKGRRGRENPCLSAPVLLVGLRCVYDTVYTRHPATLATHGTLIPDCTSRTQSTARGYWQACAVPVLCCDMPVLCLRLRPCLCCAQSTVRGCW